MTIIVPRNSGVRESNGIILLSNARFGKAAFQNTGFKIPTMLLTSATLFTQKLVHIIVVFKALLTA